MNKPGDFLLLTLDATDEDLIDLELTAMVVENVGQDIGPAREKYEDCKFSNKILTRIWKVEEYI